MDVTVLAPAGDREEHRLAIWDLLRTRPRLTRILALNMHDVDLVENVTLREAIRKLLDARLTVTIVIGERLTNSKDEEERKRLEKIVEFLKDLSDRGANVYVQRSLHAKLIFTEEAKEADALITSANFTPTALWENYEAGVKLHDLDIPSLRKLRDFTNRIIGLRSTRSIEDVV